MGLPLFIPPVESDIRRKSHKTASTSPPRTNIRRLPYTGDRPSAHRTARLLEHIQNSRPLPRAVANALNSENVSTEMVSAAEYGNGTYDEPSSRPDASDSARDPRRPARMLRMDQRFGTDWRNRDWEQPQQDLESDWWVVEHRLWGGRARLTRLGPDLARARSYSRAPQARASIMPQPRGPSRMGSSRVSPLSLPWTSATVNPWSPEPSRREANDDMNGLGDRMRSVSPEGWDTLLTTLTPDPQPPSVNSSFVSTVASQNFGASSSNTSLSDQLRSAEPAVEQPCEPGQDNSDGEDEENTRTPVAPRVPSRAANPVRFNVPEYSSLGSTESGPMQRSNEAGQRHRSRANYLAQSAEDSHAAMLRLREAWVGQLSVGSQDEDQADSRSRRLDVAYGGPTVTHELSGWQRIVRGLADRDDIPDEWWAEAGLSRTLRE